MSLGCRDVELAEEDLEDAYAHCGEAAYGHTVIDVGMDERVLDYHDCLLRVRDVALLTGKENWLNDNLLSFYFTFLRREKFVHLHDDVAFVDGSVGFLVANLPPGEVGVVLEPLQLDKASVVLFQVNNNSDVGQAEGGSHWSLLVFRRGKKSRTRQSRELGDGGRVGSERGSQAEEDGADAENAEEEDSFLHYDSAGGVNARAADALAAAVAPWTRGSGYEREAKTSGGEVEGEGEGGGGAGAATRVNHMPEAAPRQANGHDCGLYVLAVADAVCSARAAERETAAAAGSGRGDDLGGGAGEAGLSLERRLNAITPAFVEGFRFELLDLVETLSTTEDQSDATR